MKGIFMLPKLSSAVQIYQCASQNNFCRAGSHRPLRVSHFHTAYLQRGIFMQFTPIPLQLPAAVGWLVGWMAGLPRAGRSTRSFSQAACKLPASFHFKQRRVSFCFKGTCDLYRLCVT